MDEGMNINYMLHHRFPFCGCFPHAHLRPIYPESQLLVKIPGYTAPTPLFTVYYVCFDVVCKQNKSLLTISNSHFTR